MSVCLDKFPNQQKRSVSMDAANGITGGEYAV